MVKRRAARRLPKNVWKRRIGDAKVFTRRGPYGNRSLVRGRGGYWGDAFKRVKSAITGAIPQGAFKNTGEMLGGLAGAAFTDNPLGEMAGATAGRWMGNKLAKLVGFGAYNVINNSLMPTIKLQEGQPVPSFADVNVGTRVRHREFVTNITLQTDHAGAFVNRTFVINPGNSTTFPWLHTIAQNYDQYEIKGMVFEYISTSSDSFTGALALGQVTLATDYDITDSEYSSFTEMQNAQYTISNKPSVDMLHPIECDPKQTNNKLLYVRASGSTTGTPDARDYDFANFQVAYNGIPSGTTGDIGQIWVTYDIVFYKPQISYLGGGGGTFFGNPTGQNAATDRYFGTALNATSGSSLVVTYGTPANNDSLHFPSATIDKYYYVYYVVYGAETGDLGIPVFTATGGELISTWFDNTLTSVRPDEESTAFKVQMCFIFKADAFNADPHVEVTASAGSLPGTITQSDLFITVCDAAAIA